MNTKEQGDIGVAQAIYYYTLKGFKTSIPNTDSTRYDLIVDKGGQLFRVQCKTTYAKTPQGVPTAQLRTLGGNQSWNGEVKRISVDETDLVWICVDGITAYEFPVEMLAGMSSVNLGKKYASQVRMGRPAYEYAEANGLYGLALGIALTDADLTGPNFSR